MYSESFLLSIDISDDKKKESRVQITKIEGSTYHLESIFFGKDAEKIVKTLHLSSIEENDIL